MFLSLVLVLLTSPLSWLLCVTTVAEYQRLIVFRLGKVRPGRHGPGVFFVLPCTDTVR